MTEKVRWLHDARIDARMHAQGLPLDMMLSVDRGSDAVVLRVTTRHLSREEARELGSRLIEAALLAGERDDVEQERPLISSPCRTCGCILIDGALCTCPHPHQKKIVRVVDRNGDSWRNDQPDVFWLESGPSLTASLDDIVSGFGIREVHFEDGSVQQL